jgi:hypothetical protein
MSADELSSAKATLETQKSELEAERDRLKEKLDFVEESSKKLTAELEVKMAHFYVHSYAVGLSFSEVPRDLHSRASKPFTQKFRV